MALKKKLSKAEFDKLPEHLKAEYITDGDGFKLDLTDEEDTGPLKRALEREKANAATSKQRLAEVEEELAQLNSNDARKRGDIATLETQWKKKQDESAAQYEARIAKLTGYTSKTLIDGTANAIAAKISTVPALMSKAIRERLTVDFDGEEPTLKILDASGKPSAMTLEDLSKEFVANKDFSGIIIGSKATGGGAAKDGFAKRNGGAVQNDTDKPVSLASMNPRDLAANIKAKREANQE